LKNVTVNLVCERASKEQQLECELAITTRARELAATSRRVASMPSSRGIRGVHQDHVPVGLGGWALPATRKRFMRPPPSGLVLHIVHSDLLRNHDY